MQPSRRSLLILIGLYLFKITMDINNLTVIQIQIQYPSSAKWDNYENKGPQIHIWLSVNLFSFLCTYLSGLSKDESGYIWFAMVLMYIYY